MKQLEGQNFQNASDNCQNQERVSERLRESFGILEDFGETFDSIFIRFWQKLSKFPPNKQPHAILDIFMMIFYCFFV